LAFKEGRNASELDCVAAVVSVPRRGSLARWRAPAKAVLPLGSAWLEEAIVGAFSIRGLGHLAESWKQNPPFAGDNEFGTIADYRHNIIKRYAALADAQGITRDPTKLFAGPWSSVL